MKEIDFIPEWYKADRKRKRRYVRQSTLIGVAFVIMMIWGMVIDRYVVSVKADVQDIQDAFTKAQTRVQEAMELQGQIDTLEQKASWLDKLTLRTPMTAVLAEVSYLMHDKVILSDLSLKNEPIEELKENQTAAPGAVVQIGVPKEKNEDVVGPQIPTRVVMTLTGIASQPADAAVLIARLEDSPYFDSVTLVFSKPKDFKETEVTEFKIRSYVADYRIQE